MFFIHLVSMTRGEVRVTALARHAGETLVIV